ncbi:MAG: CvpA family protein [Anaerolineaceae bacterium]|nr:CvpA family protein [Anaerolineaceae bacterium]
MIYLHTLLWFLIILFAIIGISRGAAKELLVTISVLIAIFVLSLLELTEFFKTTLAAMEDGMVLFWVRCGILTIFALAGYHTPSEKFNLRSQITPNEKIEHFTGFIIGALNGFLIFGTLWFFIHAANYPGETIFSSVNGPVAELNERALNFLEFLPPSWLQGTVLYVVVAFLVMFILIMVI